MDLFEIQITIISMIYLKRTPVSLRLLSEMTSFFGNVLLSVDNFCFILHLFLEQGSSAKRCCVEFAMFNFYVSENVKYVTGRFLSAAPFFFFTFCPTVKKKLLLLILDIALFGLRTFRL